jgi:phosphoglycolate phosphatase
MYENSVYPGIAEILHDLWAKGKTLAIATTKATFYTVKILENLDFLRFFSYISGDELDGSLTKNGKRDILRLVLDNLDPKRERAAVMIGDKEYDISAAGELGIDSIGLGYGYGSRDELAGATWIADTTDELRKLVLHDE